MRQVPHYCLVGRGRLAKHFNYYFRALGLTVSLAHRGMPESLESTLTAASHVLLLISDSAIVPFIEAHPQLQTKTLLHCSGSLQTNLAASVHPLMTFGHTLYQEDVYPQIPFIIETEGPAFSTLLPGVPNPHYAINKTDKPLYHALCVLANNFSTVLWQKVFTSFSNEFNIEAKALQPILMQTFQNLTNNPSQALTGPLVRGDTATLTNDLNALSGDPFQHVFEAICTAYQQQKECINECE